MFLIVILKPFKSSSFTCNHSSGTTSLNPSKNALVCSWMPRVILHSQTNWKKDWNYNWNFFQNNQKSEDIFLIFVSTINLWTTDHYYYVIKKTIDLSQNILLLGTHSCFPRWLQFLLHRVWVRVAWSRPRAPSRRWRTSRGRTPQCRCHESTTEKWKVCCRKHAFSVSLPIPNTYRTKLKFIF